MGLFILVLGLVVFLGVHVLTTLRERRATLIARSGEGAYKGVYSLVALIGLLLIAYGYATYRATAWTPIWNPPVWTRHVTDLLVWPAIILVVAAYVRGRIYTAVKHPMLLGAMLWAVAHLLANGDLGSILLFGAVLVWAVYDRFTLLNRTDPGAPPIPVGGVRNDVIAVVVGTLLYLALGFWFHPWIIGVPAFG